MLPVQGKLLVEHVPPPYSLIPPHIRAVIDTFVGPLSSIFYLGYRPEVWRRRFMHVANDEGNRLIRLYKAFREHYNDFIACLKHDTDDFASEKELYMQYYRAFGNSVEHGKFIDWLVQKYWLTQFDNLPTDDFIKQWDRGYDYQLFLIDLRATPTPPSLECLSKLKSAAILYIPRGNTQYDELGQMKWQRIDDGSNVIWVKDLERTSLPKY